MADNQDLMQMRPIGFLRSIFQFKNGTPRQPSVCTAARGSLMIEKDIFNNPEHALEGLEQFSHAWIVFVFDKNKPGHSKAKVKPPRLNGKRVGVFSTRSPYRPNAIGLTLARIERISGSTVHFSGIDIVDGTPVLDIKPFIPQYDIPTCRGEALTTVNTSASGCSDTDTSRVQDCSSEERSMGVSDGYTNSGISPLKSNDDSQPVGVVLEGSSSERLNTKEEEGFEYSYSSQQTYRIPAAIVGKAYGTRETIVPSDVKLPTSLVASPGVLSNSGQTLTAGEKLTASVNEKNEQENVLPTTTDTSEETRDTTQRRKERQVEETASGDIASASLEDPDIDRITSLSPDYPLRYGAERHGDMNDHEKTLRSNSDFLSETKGHTTVTPDASIAQWLSAPPVSKLHVSFTPTAETQLEKFATLQNGSGTDSPYRLDFLSGSDDIRTAIVSVLSEDPRSVYRREKCRDALYFFTVDQVHVTCWFDDSRAEVVRLQPLSVVEKLTVKS